MDITMTDKIAFTYFEDNKRDTEHLRSVGVLEKTDANWFCALFNNCKQQNKNWETLSRYLLRTRCPEGAQLALKYNELKIPMENLHFFSDYKLTDEEFNEAKAYYSVY